MLHEHGRLGCRVCFAPGDTQTHADGYRLVNDPGYWGAPDPVVLVLGQSKGRNQWLPQEHDFDSVAFAGIRDRLRNILERAGIGVETDDFDSCFRADESYFGFASLVRCSLSRADGTSSGSPVSSAMRSPAADSWIRTCMERWFTQLNPNLRLVVLLGTTDAYVRAVSERLRDLHPATFRAVNDTTLTAAGVIWTFMQHPSTVSENHYRRWIGDEPYGKRAAAQDAVRAALKNPRSASSTVAPPPNVDTNPVPAPSQNRPASPESRSDSRVGGGPRRSDLRDTMRSVIADEPDIVRRGALKIDNKKLSDWQTQDGVVFAYEHAYGYVWVPDDDALRDLLSTIPGKVYPASHSWREVGAGGKRLYGRHSGLRSIPELRDGDLIRFAPETTTDVVRILHCLRVGREAT